MTDPTTEALHALERQLMDFAWRTGEVSAREALEELNGSHDQQRAYTTVLTVLSRLEHKGFLSKRRVGRGDRYAPAVERDAWLAGRGSRDVDTLIETYGDAALAQFAGHVAKLDPARRAALQRLLDGDG